MEVFSQNFSLISPSNFAVKFLSIILLIPLKILLQGLDPNLCAHQAAFTLYEKEVGPKPKKVCHFGFLEHVLLEEFGITIEEST